MCMLIDWFYIVLKISSAQSTLPIKLRCNIGPTVGVRHWQNWLRFGFLFSFAKKLVFRFTKWTAVSVFWFGFLQKVLCNVCALYWALSSLLFTELVQLIDSWSDSTRIAEVRYEEKTLWPFHVGRWILKTVPKPQNFVFLTELWKLSFPFLLILRSVWFGLKTSIQHYHWVPHIPTQQLYPVKKPVITGY